MHLTSGCDVLGFAGKEVLRMPVGPTLQRKDPGCSEGRRLLAPLLAPHEKTEMIRMRQPYNWWPIT